MAVLPGKRCRARQERGDVHGVYGAHLLEVIEDLLAHRAVRFLVPHGRRAVVGPSPGEPPPPGGGERRFIPFSQHAHGSVDVFGQRQRRGALQENEDAALEAGPSQRVGQCVLRRGQVAAEFRRPPDHFRTPGATHGGDFRVVRGDDDPADGLGPAGRFDGPGDERLSAQRPDVFAGQPLGAPTGGNDGQRWQDEPSSTDASADGQGRGTLKRDRRWHGRRRPSACSIVWAHPAFRKRTES